MVEGGDVHALGYSKGARAARRLALVDAFYLRFWMEPCGGAEAPPDMLPLQLEAEAGS